MRCHVELESLRFQHPFHALYLQTHHIGDFVVGEWHKHNGFVDTVEEFGPYGFLQQFHHRILRLLNQLTAVAVVQLGKLRLDVLAAQVGSHDDDGVLKVNRTSFVVSQTTIVEHL